MVRTVDENCNFSYTNETVMVKYRVFNWRNHTKSVIVLISLISVYLLFYFLFQMALQNPSTSDYHLSDSPISNSERRSRLYDKMASDLSEHGPVFLKHGETSQSLSLSDIFELKDGVVTPVLKPANPPVRANVLYLDKEFSVPISEAVRSVFQLNFDNAIWFQNSSLYHFSMSHASHHISPVPATEDEIIAEAKAVQAAVNTLCPLKIVLDRVVLTSTGVLLGCWQVKSGTDPITIRGRLRDALPHAPEKQLYDAAILHTSFARLLGHPTHSPKDLRTTASQLTFFNNLVNSLNDQIKGSEAVVSELWYVEEHDVLALALNGRMKKNQQSKSVTLISSVGKMEDISRDDSATSVTATSAAMTTRSKLRYPLRSASKVKEEMTATPVPFSVKRNRTVSSVSKSMNVLDLSAKEKSAKPPRKLSIPTKTPGSSVSKSIGTITPIYEAGAKRSIYGHGKSDTPSSDVSKSGTRKRFSVLSSASYWLSQIKLSESAARHSISLGFFKLALEAGCEPLQRVRDELKAYARRHNLVELGDLAKEVFEGYTISDNLMQPQVSETVSQVPEVTRSSDDDVHSSSFTMGTGNLQPKSLNIDGLQTPAVTEPADKEKIPKTVSSSKRTKGSLNKVQVGTKPVTRNIQNKPQKTIKQESNKGKNIIKKHSKKGASGEVNPSPVEETVEENKENMGASPAEEIATAEVI